MKNKKLISIQQMTLIGLMTALICVISPFSFPIPFSPVPISFATMVLFFCVYILGTKRAVICYFIYMLIGLVGLPVFSGFSSGLGKLLGPTGGYLIGYLFMILCSGFFIQKFPSHKLLCILGMCLGSAICYLFGSLWLSFVGHMNLLTALGAGVLPFIPGDLIKIAITAVTAPSIYKMLARANLVS